jgi:hypothetical protein
MRAGMIKYNTIDLDINPRIPNNDNHLLEKIVEKISLCEYSYFIQVLDSNSKGYHILFYCSKNCDLCRFVFDDDKRYSLDVERPEWRQNIMFDIKGVQF